MYKRIIFLAAVAVLLVGAALVMKLGNVGTSALWDASRGGTWLLPLVGVAALLDSVNPCAFSILLLTVGFLLSLGTARSGVVRIGGAYIAGVFTAYLLIGFGLLGALHLFNTPHFMAKVGAVLLIVMGGAGVLNNVFPSFPVKFRIPQAAHRKMAALMGRASLPAALLLGALVGLCEFPCTGGPYLMVLGLLHDQGTYFAGVGYLVLYNLIFVLPLVIMLGIASDAALIEKVRSWKRAETGRMRLWGGIAMILLGLAMFAF